MTEHTMVVLNELTTIQLALQVLNNKYPELKLTLHIHADGSYGFHSNEGLKEPEEICLLDGICLSELYTSCLKITEDYFSNWLGEFNKALEQVNEGNAITVPTNIHSADEFFAWLKEAKPL